MVRFWLVGAAVPLRFAVLKPRLWGLFLVPSPNSAQTRPARLAKALPKAFAYWIQMWRFRPPGGIGFGPFLARLGPPCRCVWLFWRVHVWCVLGAPKCRPAEPSTPGYATAQPSSSSPSPAPSPAQPAPPLAHPPAQPAPPAQPSPASPQQPISSVQPKPPQPRPKPWCGPCQTSAKGFFLY